MEFGGARKRGRGEAALNGNDSHKKFRPHESDSFPTGVGSKSKPCTKFFSTSGCPFGEGCHFLHYVPGGYKAVSQTMNLSGGNPPTPAPPSRMPPPSFPNPHQPPTSKSRLCNKFNSPEGCKYGDKCHFAHGEWELNKPTFQPHEDPRFPLPHPGMRPGGARIMEPNNPVPSFGLSSTAKISIDASVAGAVIGKGGVHSKQICRVTGAKLAVRDHENDPNLRNIELEGTFDQIKQASAMVHELIMNFRAGSMAPSQGHRPSGGGAANNFKTKLCGNFAKGLCTFGEKCHFAHGTEELRKSAM